MNISVEKLLAKIENELKLAKTSSKEETLREKIYSIKILCELILDEKQASVKPAAAAIQPAVTQQVYQQPLMNQQVFQQGSSLQQPKKLDMEDEANGDSLFDF
ncbi:YwdI family protein [Neobacillus drentensis]|uniref:YwdI family protein n=1 Tax=Neobacillus drentensis TaxID=220684 RepID=UPI001F296F4A|nr:YwdI family protein [Neobacillus drentensis]ULT56952.1 YwdI family protein [Neobacillus drentensis]